MDNFWIYVFLFPFGLYGAYILSRLLFSLLVIGIVMFTHKPESTPRETDSVSTT